jgi:hypothetical protein
MPSLSLDEIQQFSKLDTKIFVETGTYEGETTKNVKDRFESIYTIELSPLYAEQARQKFQNQKNIQVIEGDSSTSISSICSLLEKPTFFWLDGHYSGGNTAQGSKDCPLLEEVEHIVTKCKPACVIAIDDVRLFNKKLGEDWTEITKEAILQKCLSRIYRLHYFPSSEAADDRMIIELLPL